MRHFRLARGAFFRQSWNYPPISRIGYAITRAASICAIIWASIRAAFPGGRYKADVHQSTRRGPCNLRKTVLRLI